MKLYKLMRKPPFFLSASTWMDSSDQPVKSSNKSRDAVIIPLMLMQYGSIKDKLKSMKTTRPKLVTSITEMRRSAKGLKDNPKQGTKKIDTETLQQLQDYAIELGISQIGFTKVNPDYIFKNFEILYPNAMILTMNMEKNAMKHTPSTAATEEIWRTYSQLGITVNKLAKFLREKGINCHASPAIGGDINTVPVAEEAGLGAVGKNGLLITPEFGPSQRIAAVFIDAEGLPTQSVRDNEHLWVKDFCETCNNCVHKCPGEAIYKETKTLEDGNPQYVDREKCAPHFSKNCGRCIGTCPFINGNYDKIKASFMTKKSHQTHNETSMS